MSDLETLIAMALGAGLVMVFIAWNNQDAETEDEPTRQKRLIAEAHRIRITRGDFDRPCTCGGRGAPVQSSGNRYKCRVCPREFRDVRHDFV